MRFLVYLMSLLFVGTAIAQNPTILQGNYISNVFGQSNFILNPNAQTNIANVTTVTATVTRSTTTPLVATSEFNVAIGTANGTATWATRAFDAGMKGQNCEARFTYRGFAATSKVHIKQGANTVASLNLTPATDPRIASINFPCGDLSAATTFVVTDTAILAGTNEIGGIYTGLATNMANVAQAELLFNARGNAGQTLSPFVTATIIFNSVTFDSQNSYDVATGIYTVKKPGRYIIFARVGFTFNNWDAGNNNKLWVRKNGTISGTTNWSTVTESRALSPQITHTVDVNTGDTLNISMYQDTSGNKTVATINDFSEFSISRFPTSSELVVTPERQNTFGSVTYRGANDIISLFSGVAASTNYTTYNDATWSGYRDFKGSRCEAPTSANDIGCQIKNLPVGSYKVTISGSMYERLTAVNDVICSYKIRETITSSDVAYSTNRSFFADGGVVWNGRTLVGTFRNTSVGDRNFVIQAAKTADSSGTTGRCELYVGTSGADLSDFNIIIEPLDQPSNSALYVQGPVLGAQTGAAIPAGYQHEGITAVSSTLTGQTNGVVKTGTGIPLNPGVYFIDMFVEVGNVAPNKVLCGISKTVNGSPIDDDRAFTTSVTIVDAGNVSQAYTCKSYGYFKVTTATTFYPVGYATAPTSSLFSYSYQISAIRLN